MKEDNELSISELRKKHGESKASFSSNTASQKRRDDLGRSHAQVIVESAPEQEGSLPFDPLRILGGLIVRWYWMVVPGILFAGIGIVIGLWTVPYQVSIQLLRQSMPVLSTSGNAGESLKPRELSSATLLGLLKSVELLRNVSVSKEQRIDPPVSYEELEKGIEVRPERNSDVVTVRIAVKGSPKRVVDTANLYLFEVHKFFRQFSEQEIGLIKATFQNTLRQTESDLYRAQDNLRLFLQANQSVDLDKQIELYLGQRGEFDVRLKTAEIELETLDARIRFLRQEMNRQRPEDERLTVARQELTALLAKYTDAHPAVQAQRAKLASLEFEATNNPAPGEVRPSTDQGSMASSLYRQILDLEGQRVALTNQTALMKNEVLLLQTNLSRLSDSSQKYVLYKSRVQEYQIALSVLESRQREAELQEARLARLGAADSGYFRQLGEARLIDVDWFGRWTKVAAAAVGGLLIGLLFGGGLVLLVEVFDSRLRTAGDVERMTQLPVLAALGDLRKMDEKAKIEWAFRAWTMISGRLSYSPNRGLVCGFISARHGEGRSTWIDLLVDAANHRGLKVLTITTQRSSSSADDESSRVVDTESPAESPADTHADGRMLSSSALLAPARVAEKLTGPDALPVVQIPLPGWVWNLERRAQWHSALTHWQTIDNLVLLVELPPASVSEAVLLAENLPQVIWLTGSGIAETGETRQYLETLRHARCNMVGAVLNFEPSYPILDRLMRRFRG